ncbi:hypothetical protein QFZ78_000574 [Paenibacillus sp. V4I5]|nr:hypothetical protein [Paenibacillus sp. V4I5]
MDEIPDYDYTNRVMAMTKIMETNSMLTGIIYQNKEKKSYEDSIPSFAKEGLSKQDLKLSEADFSKMLTEFK